MRIVVTGSSGHLGEALVRVLATQGRSVVGIDVVDGPFTEIVGTIEDAELVRSVIEGAEAVIHPATLHKPHVATHPKQRFVDVNVTGTLTLLEQAVEASVSRFVFTSTTSAFGAALSPPPEAPAAWIHEDVASVPKNIYGVTKTAAEDLCQLFHRRHGLPVVVLRTSRFFPEEDDSAQMRQAFSDTNTKANEFLFRRVELTDVVQAHLLAMQRAPELGFTKLIVSATTPFRPNDVAELRRDAPSVVERYVPDFRDRYAALGFRMFPTIDRVYDNARARSQLGWQPRFDFEAILQQLERDEPLGSPLVGEVGIKGYHPGRSFEDGPFPV